MINTCSYPLGLLTFDCICLATYSLVRLNLDTLPDPEGSALSWPIGGETSMAKMERVKPALSDMISVMLLAGV